MSPPVSRPKLYDIVVARECRNTHHKLVMNSLLHLQCPNAEGWVETFVEYFEDYLEGSKAPDNDFKDFRNHVLHVSDGYWGGAAGKTRKWYAETVSHLKMGEWRDAVYSAGVLSHYYMDPIMPLHTGQTEEEGVIHRACEWSINKSFSQLISQLEANSGYPTVELPLGEDWITQAVHQGAEVGHQHYQTFIDHYNIEVGKKDPPAGLDPTLKKITAELLGYASVGFARILERAIEEAKSEPKSQSSSARTWFYRLTAPISWMYKSVRNFSDWRTVSRIASEYENTGKVVKNLPKDEKEVRSEHAIEILKIELDQLDKQTIKPVGSKHSPPVQQQPGSEKTPKTIQTSTPKRTDKTKSQANGTESSVPVFQEVDRPEPAAHTNRNGERKKRTTFRLDPKDDLEAAPSIGPKTAKRFADIGIRTVGEFLHSDPEITSVALGTRHLSADTIYRFQTQARLACQIPGIAGHDAQILEGCGFEDPEEVAGSDVNQILSLVDEFANSPEAKYIIRDGKQPDLREVSNWVQWAQDYRDLDAA